MTRTLGNDSSGWWNFALNIRLSHVVHCGCNSSQLPTVNPLPLANAHTLYSLAFPCVIVIPAAAVDPASCAASTACLPLQLSLGRQTTECIPASASTVGSQDGFRKSSQRPQGLGNPSWLRYRGYLPQAPGFRSRNDDAGRSHRSSCRGACPLRHQYDNGDAPAPRGSYRCAEEINS
jgi:hypothetical protein